ncbi:MAG: TonB-dependent receptor [Tannerella sp.]|jgi:TonB-linked SusC/RagA family outer membrane protein|nr:TonB-dependent receptor [Tannerella sp.]
MKITFTFLFLCITGLFASELKSQMVRVNISMKNVMIMAVLNEIERQTDYLFLFSPEEIDMEKKTSVKVKNQSVAQVLSSVFRDTDISYAMEGNTIFLMKGNDFDIISAKTLQSNKIPIKGIVKDHSGEPVIGANVVEKGTLRGITTDMDGKFTLNIEQNGILQISYIGYITQEITVKDRQYIEVILLEDTRALDEIVVVGYGVQKKANLTGAVASIKSQDILKAQSANTSNALIGRIPGLIAKQTTGEPGQDGSQLYIRGIATFQGGTNPTYIIDGIERQAEDFARIDPNDIESLNVLKDAASAAVFGMRGANGVILVTTKRGKAEKATITYSGNISIQKPASLPKFANSADYARMKNIYMGNEIYTADEIAKFANGSDPERYPNTDWYNAMLSKNAVQHQHNLNISGGRDDLKFFTSFGYVNQGGLWDNLSYERYSLRANIDARITKTTNLSVDVSGRVDYRDGSQHSSGGIFQQLIRNTPILIYRYNNGLMTIPDTTHPNIIAQSSPEAGYNNSRNNSLLTRMELLQELPFITEGLKVKGILSYDKNNYASKTWYVSPYLYIRNSQNPDDYILQPRGGASLSQNQNDNEYVEFQGHLTYDRSYGNHNVSGLVMALARKEKYHTLWVSRTSYDSDAMDQLSAGNATGQQMSGYDTESARISYVGRANYNYANKYMFEANLRRDASENFSPDKRWGTFMSASAGWVASEEAFFNPLKDKINFLKLRASYGTLGNDNIGGVAFPYYSRFDLYAPRGRHSGGLSNDLGDYVFGELVTKGLVPGPIANALATWEKSKKTNIGIDAGLFNLINLSVDYFHEKRSNILAQRGAEVPWSFGGTLPLENIGKVKNRGVDAMLTFNHKTGQVRYSLGGNFTYAKNEILEMAEAAGTSEYMKRTGRPIHSYYGYKTDGIFQRQAEIDAYPKQEVAGVDYRTKPGDIKYLDVNGDEKVDAADMTYLGYGNVPETVYGFNGSVQYKNFDFSFLFQGAGHVQVYLNGGVVMPYFNDGNLPEFWVNEAWTEQSHSNRYPRLEQSNHNFPNTDFSPVQTYLYNASYLRLKNIELGYNIPQQLLDKVKMRVVRIYISGQNLFTITDVPQIDPENVNSQGWSYPQMTSFNAGINIQF